MSTELATPCLLGSSNILSPPPTQQQPSQQPHQQPQPTGSAGASATPQAHPGNTGQNPTGAPNPAGTDGAGQACIELRTRHKAGNLPANQPLSPWMVELIALQACLALLEAAQTL
ncbi:hypothetical protein L208DRAFT_1381111 [Tricholoma matsutake]|nr:hypothetical protein L208DRAFT_1381111 [Tricholoma matsutake 945]